MCSLQLACSLSVQCHKLSSTLFPAAAGNLLGLAAKERDTFLRRWWCGPQQTWAARRVHRHQLYQLYMVIVCRSFIHSLFCWPQKNNKKNKTKKHAVGHSKWWERRLYLLLRRCSTAARSTAPRGWWCGAGTQPSRRPAAWRQKPVQRRRSVGK